MANPFEGLVLLENSRPANAAQPEILELVAGTGPLVLREAAEFDAHLGFVAVEDGDTAFEAETWFAGVTGV